jgi:hypothetical protein
MNDRCHLFGVYLHKIPDVKIPASLQDLNRSRGRETKFY